jgi:hypothetical protein
VIVEVAADMEFSPDNDHYTYRQWSATMQNSGGKIMVQ